jgi:hypothetical protein
MDFVGALRQLFDTFKPGGEGQAPGVPVFHEIHGLWKVDGLVKMD